MRWIAMVSALVLTGCGQADVAPATEPTSTRAGTASAASVESPGDDTASAFLSICAQRTIVMGRARADGEIAQIGDTLDGECRGYLRGTFDAMLRAREICPDGNSLPDDHLLLSIVETYAESAGSLRRSRQEFVWAAFTNAYSCPNR